MRADVRIYTYLISLDLEQDISFPQIKYSAIKPSLVFPDLCVEIQIRSRTLGEVRVMSQAHTCHHLKEGKMEQERNHPMSLSYSFP